MASLIVQRWRVRCFSRRGGKMMIGRLGKKWLAGLFILFSVLLAGCVNSEADLLSKHNAITVEQWGEISADELADALEKGEFNPDQLILNTANGKRLSILPAIVMAAFNDQEEHIRLLLDYGANPDLSGKIGSYELTALNIAAHNEQMEMMEMLLKAGANPNIRTKKIANRTTLHHLLDVLEEGLNEKEMMARDEELKNIIALLVAKGADINAVDENGENIIHYLTLQCKADLIRYAVQMGANINHENEDFGTPLLRASKVFRDSIPALLEAGADPNYVSSKGGVFTPLNIAVVVVPNPTIVIQTLLDGGADIDLGKV
ncbi:MAG: ankyrin repeat domain-containing protein [Candidatus Zeuxoniibacter abyssi]|nr:MAG: ankyrin repeat domain-containing protein [Candidatus Persebacteraceae bacterium AB1(2)]